MNRRTLACISVIALIAPAIAAAEDHSCGCCAGDPHAATAVPAAPPYALAYEGLFAGVVYSIARYPGTDVELTIGVGERTFKVLVAPTTWLDAIGGVFRPGERVEVVGALWHFGAGETIVAREIHTVGQTIVVRDADGRPLWN